MRCECLSAGMNNGTNSKDAKAAQPRLAQQQEQPSTCRKGLCYSQSIHTLE